MAINKWEVIIRCQKRKRFSRKWKNVGNVEKFIVDANTKLGARGKARILMRRKGCKGPRTRKKFISVIRYQSTDSAYIKNVKPIRQEVISNPGRGLRMKRFEGCGPVAAASLLGYWKTEKRLSRIRDTSDTYIGEAHPYKTIREFYKESNAKASPSKKEWYKDEKEYNQSFVTVTGMVRALKCFINMYSGHIKVERRIRFRLWSKRLKWLQDQLKKGNPVVLMFHRKMPISLTKDKKESKGWHYVVAVGYNNEKRVVYLVTGWKELKKETTSGPNEHKVRSASDCDGAHVVTPYKELKYARMSLVWIQKK